jgi:hypothetical protein
MQPQPARENPTPACQGVSPLDEVCEESASVHCTACEQWFCDAHAEDDQWHACAIAEEADEGAGG